MVMLVMQRNGYTKCKLYFILLIKRFKLILNKWLNDISNNPHEQDDDRKPGDRWMIRGPKEYVPPVEVEVVMKRQAIPLDENEGIYVRDVKTGKVKYTMYWIVVRFLP